MWIRKESNITKNNKMTGISICLKIMILNVNGLNFPIKRHRLAVRIIKQDIIVFISK
jgi:hypothetical protein